MEQETQAPQPNNKNKKLIGAVIVSFLIAAFIFGSGAYFITRSSYDKQRQILEKNITNLQTQINDLKNKENDGSSSETLNNTDQTTNNNDVDSMFVSVPKELLRRDSTVALTPTDGYLITTSIVSNKKDKVVYSEISDCIKALNLYGYDADGQTCDLKYNIFIKDLQTGETNKIYSYSYSESTSFFQNLQKLIADEANAGGCLSVYFPIAWSKDDQKIIFKQGNPTNCGSEGTFSYFAYTLSSSGGGIEYLSRYDSVFLDNYSKVIFIDESSKSPLECGPIMQDNYGKIVLKYIETGKTVVLLEEPNSRYSHLSIDSNQVILNYSVEKVKDVKGCSEVDLLVAKKTGQLQIPL